MRLLLAFLSLVMPLGRGTAPSPRASGAGRAGTFLLGTRLRAAPGPFQVLYFYDDSTFVALSSANGLVAHAQALELYPENGYLLFRGRVRPGQPADRLCFSLIKRSHVQVIGETLPLPLPAVPCRSTPAGALLLVGSVFRPVASTRLGPALRTCLLRQARRPGSTQDRFDCR